MARFFFSLLPSLLVLGLAVPGAGASLHVEDDFLDAIEPSGLVAQLPTSAEAKFQQLVDVPASLLGRLVSALAPGQPVKAASVAATTAVPARSERGNFGHHQDVFAHNNDLVTENSVGLIYLGGDGHMAFRDKTTGEETVVDVKPGRFLAWDNTLYTHSLVAGKKARMMVGPMAFKDGMFHQVGHGSHWDTTRQLTVNSMLPKPGTCFDHDPARGV